MSQECGLNAGAAGDERHNSCRGRKNQDRRGDADAPRRPRNCQRRRPRRFEPQSKSYSYLTRAGEPQWRRPSRRSGLGFQTRYSRAWQLAAADLLRLRTRYFGNL